VRFHCVIRDVPYLSPITQVAFASGELAKASPFQAFELENNETWCWRSDVYDFRLQP
jgi:hypothetical protein